MEKINSKIKTERRNYVLQKIDLYNVFVGVESQNVLSLFEFYLLRHMPLNYKKNKNLPYLISPPERGSVGAAV